MANSNIHYHVWLLTKNGKFQKVVKEVPVEFCLEGDGYVMLTKLDNYIFEAFKNVPDLHSYGYVIGGSFNHVLICIDGKKNTCTNDSRDFRYYKYDTFRPYTLTEMWSMISVPNQSGEYIENLQHDSLEFSDITINLFVEMYKKISDYAETLKHYIQQNGYVYNGDTQEYDKFRLLLKYVIMAIANMDISIYDPKKDFKNIETYKNNFESVKKDFETFLNSKTKILTGNNSGKILANKLFLIMFDFFHLKDSVQYRPVSLKDEIIALLENISELSISRNEELIEIIKKRKSKSSIQNKVQDFDDAFDDSKYAIKVNPKTAKHAAKMPISQYELNNMFDAYNKLIFDNGCKKVSVVYDLISAGVYGLNKSKMIREGFNYVGNPEWIKITCKYQLSEEQIRSTLMHEMIHNYMSVHNAYEYVKDAHGYTFLKWCKKCEELTGITVSPKQETIIGLKKTNDTNSEELNPVIITISNDKRYYLAAKTKEKYLKPLLDKINAINTLYSMGKTRYNIPGGYLYTDKFNATSTVRTLGKFNIITKETYDELTKDNTFIPFK